MSSLGTETGQVTPGNETSKTAFHWACVFSSCLMLLTGGAGQTHRGHVWTGKQWEELQATGSVWGRDKGLW